MSGSADDPAPNDGRTSADAGMARYHVQAGRPRLWNIHSIPITELIEIMFKPAKAETSEGLFSLTIPST